MRKLFIFAMLLIGITLLSANAMPGQSLNRPLYAPDKVKIQLTKDAYDLVNIPEVMYAEAEVFGIEELDNLLADLSFTKIIRAHRKVKDTQWEKETGFDRWFIIGVPTGTDILRSLTYLKSSIAVEQAIPEYYAYTQLVPNDTYYANNWGHNNTAQLPVYQGGSHSGPGVGTIGFDSNAQAAWDDTQGLGSASVIIGIIDTGVDLAHPDLRLVAGYDFGDNDSNPQDDSADPGHGTACSGVAAGIGNNALGVTGMAGGCSVMPLKIADSGGSLQFTYIENALTYAGDNNVDVGSMSFGASITYGSSPSTDAAVAYAYNHGVTLLAATANANTSSIDYPSNHPNVISVGASSPTGERKSTTSSDGEYWWGSNYGVNTQNAANAVDIMAPTILPATDISGTGGYSTTNYYMWFNGTSCATPYAAGVAALLISKNPTLTPAQVRTALTTSATDMTIDGGAGWDRYTGYGLVNAQGALASITPGMPSCTITAPANGSTHNLGSTITVNVTATDSNGTIQRVEFYLDGAGTPSYTDYSSPYSWNWNTTGATGGSHTITAKAYDNESNMASSSITVILLAPANEGFETGNFSAYPWVQSGTAPWTVQSASAFSGTYAAKSGTITHNQASTMAVTLNITSSGTISFYQSISSESNYDFLKFYIDNVEQGSWSGTGSWSFQSYAVSAGNREFKWTYSKDSSVSSGSDCAWVDHIIFPPHNPPNPYQPPQNFTASPGNGFVNLTWQAPASGTPTGYKIFKNSSLLTTVTGLSYTDNAVVNGTTYSYYLKAVYSGGESDPTPTVQATPANVTSAIIGSGTSSNGTTIACPINVYYESLHGQAVYTAVELNAAGVIGPVTITELGFNITGLPTLAMPNYLIRMNHTTASNVSNWIPASGMTTVWTTVSYQPISTGWNMLTLSTPFVWNGTDNIVIDTAFGDIGAWTQSGTTQYTTVTNGYRYVRADESDQTDVFTGGSTSTYRPNIQITFFSDVPEVPEINVTPTTLSYGTVLINTTTSNSFTISNPGTGNLSGNITTPAGYTVALAGRASERPAQTEVVSASRTAVTRNTLPYTIAEGGSSSFTVTFAPTAVQAYNGTITITHNADGASRTVSVTGQGGKPTIGLSATTFTANLAPGQTNNQSLTVSNSGNMTLNYGLVIAGSPSWLTINGGSSASNSIVAGGASQNITIGFNSAGMSPGTYNATINGTSNDPANSAFNVSVTLTVRVPITITSPVSGASWAGGSLQNIVWNYTGAGTTVTFHYSLNAGVTWINGGVLNTVSGTNSYGWIVPNYPTSSCRVRLTDSVSPNYAVSSNLFSITAPVSPLITVVSPNGGENWVIDSTYNITWTHNLLHPDVMLYYSLNNGSSWNYIATVAASAQSYAWNTPSTTSTQCLVRIVDTLDSYALDVSNNVFSLVIPAPPSTPDNVAVSYNASNGSVAISWNASTGNPTGYNVFFSESVDFTSYSLLAYVPAPQTGYNDPVAYMRPWGFYRIVAVRN